MSNKTRELAPSAENEKVFGSRGEMIWRLATGEGFTVTSVIDYFGVCPATAKNRLKRLTADGLAYLEPGTSRYRGHTEKCIALCDVMGWPPNEYGNKPVKRSNF